MLRKSCFCLLFSLLVLSGVTPCAGDIFWSELNLIRRASDDGSSVQTIVTGTAGTQMNGIAFDVPNAHLYYGVGGPQGGLYRANVDGSNPVLLVQAHASDVELDLVNRKVYWNAGYQGTPAPSLIRRANLDGTNVETLATFDPYSVYMGLALDPDAGKLYYTGVDYWAPWTAYVAQANLDGSNPVTLAWARPSEHTTDLEIDRTAGKLYVVQTGGGTYPTRLVSHLNLDGTGYETLLEMGASNLFSGIALDTAKGHLYYSDFRDNKMQIRRVNTDGTADQFVLATATVARYIEYAVPEPSSLALCIGAAIAGFYAWRRRQRGTQDRTESFRFDRAPRKVRWR